MVVISKTTVHKIQPSRSFRGTVGAELRGADLEHISEADFEIIRKALYNQVKMFKGRQLRPWKSLGGKSVLHPDLKTSPHEPQVQIIGNGSVAELEGLKNITLKHPHHKTFHKKPISAEDDRDYTRFYRWHIDAALYDLNPPRVTSLMAVKVPKTEYQNLRYGDGTADELSVPRGSTVFVSSYKMYDLLSDSDKAFARTTKVQSAPHPYTWMTNAKSRSDGLGMTNDGLELPYSELPPVDEEKIQILPMCWRNPVTNELALQIHASAIERMHLADGTVIEDLAEVREIVHRMQRPGIAPELVNAVDWEEGDIALFNNHGVLHSVTGNSLPEEVRIFRQCNLAASTPPLGPLESTVVA